MGIVKVRFKVYNPADMSRYVEVDGIVDTGAVYSVISSSLLNSIGVKPLERRRFLTFGGYVERDVGGVVIEVMGRRGAVTVIFGEEKDVNVLGVTALEALGLEVDAVRGTFRETEQLRISNSIINPYSIQSGRTLIITDNPGFTPVDRQELMNKLRLKGLRVINVRVASDHVEIDLRGDDTVMEKIRSLGFIIKESINIDEEDKSEEPNEEQAMRRYIELFNEERFWEAHEVLERIWHRNRDEGIRGLIVLAAAFVKLQENNPEAFRELMITAKELITNNEIPWINRESLLRKIDNALATMKLFKIEETDIKRI